GYDYRMRLEPNARRVGTLTPDGTRELEVDLATAENVGAHPPDDTAAIGASALINRIFNLQNRSTQDDPLVTPRIPSQIPGLTGFDLGLRTEEPASIAVE